MPVRRITPNGAKLACLLCTVVLPLVGASPATAQDALNGDGAPYSETFFFGDSLTDSGFYRRLLPSSVRPVTGAFTTNPGWVWSQYFADYYGTLAVANGNGQFGTNYAAGGANIILGGTGALGPIPSLTNQVDRYLTGTLGQADPDALYTLSSSVLRPDSDPAASGAAALLGLAQRLADGGARYIVVLGPQDIGLAPGPTTGGTSAADSARSQALSDALFAAPSPGGPRIIPIDLLTFSRELHAEAAAFGFTNVTGTACLPQIIANSLTCNPTSVVDQAGAGDARNSHLYADGVHYTSRAHDIISQYVISMLEAPRLIAELPQNLAANGIARTDRVLDRTRFGVQTAPGWWVDARGNAQVLGDAGIATGFGADILGGYDFDAGSARIGVFGGVGTSTHDFASGGGYDQSDLSLGAYAAWTQGNRWFQVQASYAASSFDVTREVTLAGRESTASLPITVFLPDEYGIGNIDLSDQTRGGVTRRHAGSTKGETLSFGANGGLQFKSGKVTHGPVAGVMAQFTTVDGYSESNADLATALGYADQDVTTLTGRFGWQAAWEGAGPLAPYARMMYQHQSTTGADEVFARSLTLDQTADFAVPGADLASNVVSATVGMRGKMGSMNTDFGATASIGQGDGVELSAFLAVSVTVFLTTGLLTTGFSATGVTAWSGAPCVPGHPVRSA